MTSERIACDGCGTSLAEDDVFEIDGVVYHLCEACFSESE